MREKQYSRHCSEHSSGLQQAWNTERARKVKVETWKTIMVGLKTKPMVETCMDSISFCIIIRWLNLGVGSCAQTRILHSKMSLDMFSNTHTTDPSFIYIKRKRKAYARIHLPLSRVKASVGAGLGFLASSWVISSTTSALVSLVAFSPRSVP